MRQVKAKALRRCMQMLIQDGLDARLVPAVQRDLRRQASDVPIEDLPELARDIAYAHAQRRARKVIRRAVQDGTLPPVAA